MLNFWLLFENCQANCSISRQVLQYNGFFQQVCAGESGLSKQNTSCMYVRFHMYVLADVVHSAYTYCIDIVIIDVDLRLRLS